MWFSVGIIGAFLVVAWMRGYRLRRPRHADTRIKYGLPVLMVRTDERTPDGYPIYDRLGI